MNSNKAFFFLLAILSVAITSCKKELSGVGRKKVDLDEVKVQPLDFKYLDTKSKVHFKDEDTDLNLSATIRFKKDSLIWFSLSPAFGIEAARGLVTQDSLILVNRLKREYMAYDFKTLSKKLNFEIDFELIQAMLLGDMPLTQSLTDEIGLQDDHIVIRQEAGGITAENFINAEKMKAERVQLAEKSSDNTLSLLYSDFEPLAGLFIPYSNRIVLNYGEGGERETILIDIDHGKVEIADSSLKFPFNIPQKYDRK